jgi:hypothetical protein
MPPTKPEPSQTTKMTCPRWVASEMTRMRSQQVKWRRFKHVEHSYADQELLGKLHTAY